MCSGLRLSHEIIKPSVQIFILGYEFMIGRGVWLEAEANAFLYGSEESLVQGEDSRNPTFGMGTLGT
jgi:hypothetical protein